MSLPELIDLSTAARLLGVPLRTTSKLLASLPVLDLGPGRGRGKRWKREDVEHLINSLFKIPAKKVKAKKELCWKDVTVDDLLTPTGLIQ